MEVGEGLRHVDPQPGDVLGDSRLTALMTRGRRSPRPLRPGAARTSRAGRPASRRRSAPRSATGRGRRDPAAGCPFARSSRGHPSARSSSPPCRGSPSQFAGTCRPATLMSNRRNRKPGPCDVGGPGSRRPRASVGL
jgi:hypothetical protein